MRSQSSKIIVVAGGQYGSEGKGAIAAYLSSPRHHPNISGHNSLIAVRVGGSNAGHTVTGRCPPSCLASPSPPPHAPTAHPWRLRHVPVAAVSHPTCPLILAAGSEIDMPVLRNEMEELDKAGYGVSSRLIIDESATLVVSSYSDQERQLTADIGSTGKGVGAARSARIMRTASTVRSAHPHPDFAFCPSTSEMLSYHLNADGTVLVEGTQGYALGLHTPNYPHTTSSDCRAIDFLAMAGLSPWSASELEVWVVFREFPIRVAGNSGPLPNETTWDAIGLPSEYTTVTGRLRRVAHWDSSLASAALRANGHPSPSVHVALTMLDHTFPSIRDMTSRASISPAEFTALRTHLANRTAQLGVFPVLLGTGPSTVIDYRYDTVPLSRDPYSAYPPIHLPTAQF